MKQYPLIEDLGLKVETYYAGGKDVIYYVKANNLEKLLSEGVKVWGKDVAPNDEYNFNTNSRFHGYTHTALLINIKPIEKPKVTKKELKEFIGYYNKQHTGPIDLDSAVELLKRIESQGIE